MPADREKLAARVAALLPLGLGIFALSSADAASPPEPCPTRADIAEVASGIFVRAGRAGIVFEDDAVANVGFVVGERCVAVVDTGGSVAEGRALDCEIRAVTDRPVCFVINTHVHPDHMLGNAAFRRDGVEFIGHAKLPRAMALRGDTYLQRAAKSEGRELDASHIVMPDRTVTDTVALDLGGRTLTVRAHRSAHTDHDVSVVDDRTNAAFVGDLTFLEHVPVIDGSINGWIAELDALKLEELAVVVPGHGPPSAGWPAAAEPTAQYLSELRERVRAWISRGGDLASAQVKIEHSRSNEWPLFGFYHQRNVGAAYAELEWED